MTRKESKWAQFAGVLAENPPSAEDNEPAKESSKAIKSIDERYFREFDQE